LDGDKYYPDKAAINLMTRRFQALVQPADHCSASATWQLG